MDMISDSLTRIRNATCARQTKVDLRHTKLVERMMEILQTEGYIRKFQVAQEGVARVIRVFLRHDNTSGYAIREIHRISKPCKRVYYSCRDIPQVKSGLGIHILTTSKGVMTDENARKAGVGGELLCSVF